MGELGKVPGRVWVMLLLRRRREKEVLLMIDVMAWVRPMTRIDMNSVWLRKMFRLSLVGLYSLGRPWLFRSIFR